MHREDNRNAPTFSSMANTISYNLDKTSELDVGAYVSAFKDCSLRAWTSKKKQVEWESRDYLKKNGKHTSTTYVY